MEVGEVDRGVFHFHGCPFNFRCVRIENTDDVMEATTAPTVVRRIPNSRSSMAVTRRLVSSICDLRTAISWFCMASNRIMLSCAQTQEPGRTRKTEGDRAIQPTHSRRAEGVESPCFQSVMLPPEGRE